MDKERLMKMINAHLICMDYSTLLKVWKFIQGL